jgi:hypothetical protein
MSDEFGRSDAVNLMRITAARASARGCNLKGAVFAPPRDGDAVNGGRS